MHNHVINAQNRFTQTHSTHNQQSVRQAHPHQQNTFHHQQRNQRNQPFALDKNIVILLLKLIQALIQSLDNKAISGTREQAPITNQQNDDNGMEQPLTDNGQTTGIRSKQVFNTPVGKNEAGPALPGDSYEITFKAKPGDKLSFAAMFVQSNDLFFAPNEEGIPLYDATGKPLEGDITHLSPLWDAGTEADEPFGSGENQAPRQAGPNSGATDPDNRVRLLDNATKDQLPPLNALIRAEIKHTVGDEFKLTLTNVSGNSTLPSPIAPGLLVVHSEASPIFTAMQADRGQGLEALAEDGDPSMLFDQIK